MSGWFPSIIVASAVGGCVWAGAAAFYSRQQTYPREVRVAGFTGTVMEFSKIAVTTGSAGLVAAVLGESLLPYPYFQHAMLAVLVVAIFNAIASYFLGASIDPKISDDGKKIKLEHRAWEIIHGFIFGSTFVSMLSTLVVIIIVSIEMQSKA